MKALNQLTSANTLEWLLDPGNPSVRYNTLFHLLNKPADNPEVTAAKQAVYTTGSAFEILGKQNEEGFWGSREKFYTEKYQGTVWQLIILADLGADI